MQLSIVSWNGSTDINNDADFAAWFDKGSLQAAERESLYVDRVQLFPKLANSRYRAQSLTLKIRCLGTVHSQRETIKKYFTPEDFTLRTLVVADTADSSRQWYAKGLVERVNEETPGVLAVTLGLDEPFWRTVAESTATFSVTASGQSTDVTVIGNMKAHPQLIITPTAGKAGDYGYSRWIPLFNKTSNNMTGYPLDVGGIDTAALIAGGKLQSAGQDLRVRIDGREVDRWFAESTDTRKMNTTDTAVWINVDLPPKTEAALLTAIASTDTVTTITLEETPANTFFIWELERANNKVFMIDSEAFTYTGVTPILKRIDGVQQARKGTSAASHSVGALLKHVPFDAYLVYGSTDATAPTVSDDRKPIISPDSTNSSHIYYNFFDSTSPRSGMFSPSVPKMSLGGATTWYTATQKTYANPASVAGAQISTYYLRGLPKAETAEVAWNINNPVGITNVQAPGSKYRYSTSWPTLAGLQYYNPSSRLWVTADNQATPGVVQTWTAFTIDSTGTGALGGTYNEIKFVLSGTVAASVGNYAAIEFDPVTLTLDSTLVPSCTPGSEVAAYRLNAVITNSTTGEYIIVNYPMATSRTITIDCDAQTATYDDGSNARGAVTFSTVRGEWLDLNVGANTITYTETNATGVTVGIEWENRNTM